MDLLVVFLLVFGMAVAQEPASQQQEPANPLPKDFLAPGLVPTVDKNQVVQALVHKVKSGAAPGDDGVDEIKTASEPHMTQGEVDRLLRAVGKLNLTSEEIKLIASEIAGAQTPAQANKVRRAVEDAAVIGGRPPSIPGGGRFPGFPFGGGGGPPPFQFQQRGGNPFFAVPLTSPALDMDLDRLLFLATPSLGIERAFELTKLLHDQGSTRADVFKLQEQFQKNVTETEATDILKSVEAKGPGGGDSSSTSSPQRILQNTAELSGLSGHEATRFARAIGKLGELNNTQAAQIHATIQQHGLNSTELKTLTHDLETVGDSLAATTTPDSAVGGDWIFSENGTTSKRAVSPLDSKTAMFSAVRSCGFVVERHTEPGVIIPWMASIQCGNVFCTGSLVSADTVLTSASCVLACGSEPVRVILGDNPVGKSITVQGVTATTNPKHASIQHPNEFDVGLIKISPAVDFNEHPFIFPVCLVGVETDDPTIECEVVVGSHLQRPQFSPVRCFQPGNQLCNSASNVVRNLACAQPTNCNIPVSSQASSPVICHRTTRDRLGAVTAQRYYLWGVAADPRQGGPSSCVHSIARVSDNFDFISGSI